MYVMEPMHGNAKGLGVGTRTGTKTVPTILGLREGMTPMSGWKGKQTLLDILGYQTHWSHSFGGLFAIDFYSAGVLFRTDNLNDLPAG